MMSSSIIIYRKFTQATGLLNYVSVLRTAINMMYNLYSSSNVFLGNPHSKKLNITVLTLFICIYLSKCNNTLLVLLMYFYFIIHLYQKKFIFMSHKTEKSILKTFFINNYTITTYYYIKNKETNKIKSY